MHNDMRTQCQDCAQYSYSTFYRAAYDRNLCPRCTRRRDTPAWFAIRQAVPDDYRRLRRAAYSFAHRHEIPLLDGLTPEDSLDLWLVLPGHPWRVTHDTARTRQLWYRCRRRALRDPRAAGIYRDTVGYIGKE
jgi:hypothetical protein